MEISATDERGIADGVSFRQNFLVALVVFGLGSAAIMASHLQSPVFHTILDTSGFLTAGLIALLLSNVSVRSGHSLAHFLAISFAIATAGELVHVTAALGWLGGGAFGIEEMQSRAATWGAPAYALAAGVWAALFLHKSPRRFGWVFAAVLALLGCTLLVLSQFVPKYSPPGFLGITRPTLIGVPLLWAAITISYWRRRGASEICCAVAFSAVVMTIAHSLVLFSQAPSDSIAMVAHFGKLVAEMLLLLSLIQVGVVDTTRRMRAETELNHINRTLELRVRERTATLQQTNAELKEQIDLREEVDRKLQIQLERLNLLNRVTRSIGERQDLPSIFQVVVRCLEEQMPADFVCILMLDPMTKSLHVAHVGGKSAELSRAMGLTEHAQVAIDDNGLLRCVRGHLVYEPRLQDLDFPFPSRLARGGLGALVISPLMVGKDVFGVLVVARLWPESFSSTDCEFQRQLSEHVALASYHAQLYNNLQKAYDELHQTQAAVLQQERLRVLGQMASGITHDINNAMSPLSLHTASLLEAETGLSVRVRSYLAMVQRVTNDVVATVARLREFYREREPESAALRVNLNTLVRQTVEFTRARWGDMPQQRGVTISVRQELEPKLAPVLGHDNEIREALTNLIFNAVDALPQGGEILLRTSNRMAESARDSRVRVEVSDNGAGMDEATRARCMEPFFTTKGERGTGLGLAMVSGAAKRHSAEFGIDSRLGQGTTVWLEFPLDEAEKALAPAIKATSKPKPMHLLLIDDDPFVLDSLHVILKLDGHTIEEACGGREGVEAFRAAQARGEIFSAVITDLGMPHLDGNHVAAAIKALSPATPVILLTGWGQRMIGGRGDGTERDKHVDIVLAKPPQLGDLRDALARFA